MGNPGHRLGVTFGALGLAVAGTLALMLGVGDLVQHYPLGVAAGSGTTLALAWGLGGTLQRHVGTGGVLRAASLGALVAVASMEAGLIAGTAVEGAPFNHVALFWTNLVGLAPAVILGSWFGVAVSAADR
jgi:hypothetical protein